MHHYLRSTNSSDCVSSWTEDDDWVLVLIQAFPKKKKKKKEKEKRKQQQKVEVLGSVTVKSQTEQFPSPSTPEVKQDVSQMESTDANRIWREIAIFPFHSEPPSDQFRKQSWLEHNWFGFGEQSRQACTWPSRTAQAVQDHLILYCIKNNVIWHVLVF